MSRKGNDSSCCRHCWLTQFSMPPKRCSQSVHNRCAVICLSVNRNDLCVAVTSEFSAPGDQRILERAASHTMTNPPQLLALIEAVRYCVARGIPGAFAECGVWLGGSILAMILTLQEMSCTDRDIYLYDTFTGMTEPSELDAAFTTAALEAEAAFGGGCAPRRWLSRLKASSSSRLISHLCAMRSALMPW